MKKQNIKSYLAITLGAGATATSADAAILSGNIDGIDVSVATEGSSIITTGLTINFRFAKGGPSYGYVDYPGTSDSYFAYGVIASGPNTTSRGFISQGYDVQSVDRSERLLQYSFSGNFLRGAQTGDQNYVNVSLNGDDDVYETVAQFYFDGNAGGRLVGQASREDGTALSISDGKAAIDNFSAVPEPSSLSLLALGASGLLLRRRIKRAA